MSASAAVLSQDRKPERNHRPCSRQELYHPRQSADARSHRSCDLKLAMRNSAEPLAPPTAALTSSAADRANSRSDSHRPDTSANPSHIRDRRPQASIQELPTTSDRRFSCAHNLPDYSANDSNAKRALWQAVLAAANCTRPKSPCTILRVGRGGMRPHATGQDCTPVARSIPGGRRALRNAGQITSAFLS